MLSSDINHGEVRRQCSFPFLPFLFSFPPLRTKEQQCLNTTLFSKAELYVNNKECITVSAEANITEVALGLRHLVNQHSIQWCEIDGCRDIAMDAVNKVKREQDRKNDCMRRIEEITHAPQPRTRGAPQCLAVTLVRHCEVYYVVWHQTEDCRCKAYMEVSHLNAAQNERQF
ncbi:unnamed protein product [Haemonchus placei]|uniref:Phlebovirus glycoprotein G2 fusion domain-containing protein n=1 Tax=Haemonchus placei TaxID=6290 RepID=A0A0N4WQD8_HAEPC|nr:unnamed protein product [Haemonchus placei]